MYTQRENSLTPLINKIMKSKHYTMIPIRHGHYGCCMKNATFQPKTL